MRTFTTATWQKLDALIDAGLACWCIEIEAKSGEAFHLCNNSRAISLNGISYRPYPFKLGEIADSSDGDLPETTLTLPDPLRVIAPYIEADSYDQGGVNAFLVYIDEAGTVTSIGYRAEWAMQSATEDGEKVTFALGQPNFMERPFPGERYIASERFPAMVPNQ